MKSWDEKDTYETVTPLYLYQRPLGIEPHMSYLNTSVNKMGCFFLNLSVLVFFLLFFLLSFFLVRM